MDDRIASWIDDLGSQDKDVRLSAGAKFEALEAQDNAGLHALVDALRSPNPIRRMEASQLLVRIVENLTESIPPLPDPSPNQAATLVMALGNLTVPYREQVESQLLTERETAIPALIQALPQATPLHASRIARLLARFEAPEGIPALLAYLSKNRKSPRDAAIVIALEELIEKLPDHCRTVDLDMLLTLLENSETAPLNADRLNNAVAVALTRMAREEPNPRLRLALKYLKRPWYKRSIAFELARRTIEEATQRWKDLPLPALESNNRDGLPVPAAAVKPTVKGLPRPIEPE